MDISKLPRQLRRGAPPANCVCVIQTASSHKAEYGILQAVDVCITFFTLENACSQRAERKLAARTTDWIFSVPLLKQHFYRAFIREGGLLL